MTTSGVAQTWCWLGPVFVVCCVLYVVLCGRHSQHVALAASRLSFVSVAFNRLEPKLNLNPNPHLNLNPHVPDWD